MDIEELGGGAVMKPIMIVSADGHASAQPDDYRPYLEARYHDELDVLAKEGEEFAVMGMPFNSISDETLKIIDDDGAMSSGGVSGGWDFERRVRELDREGIAAEIVLAGIQSNVPPFFSSTNRPHPPDLRAAGARAYHRWFADAAAGADGRIFGVADAGPCLDMDETVRELRWVADHGFVGVQIPGDTGDPELPPLYDPHYEPYWAACAELGLVMIVHAGYGLEQDSYHQMFDRITKAMSGEGGAEGASVFEDPFFSTLDSRYRHAIWQLLLSGAFDRHPDLKLVFTELGASWVPAFIAGMDARFSRGDTPLKRKPSEYWRENFGVTASSIHPVEAQMRDEIGVDHLMFGTDYPHPESTWPNTRDWIRGAFVGVPETDARQILGENAVRYYGLDGERLANIADRIGPQSEALLTDELDVSPERIQCFSQRGGFSRPRDEVDAAKLDEVLSEDVAALVGA
jgi:predicted TIM-barrel fold metal-dependent hydrolase